MDQSNIPASVQPLASGSVDEISFVNGVISNSASGSNTTAILSILGDVVSHLDVLVKEQTHMRQEELKEFDTKLRDLKYRKMALDTTLDSLARASRSMHMEVVTPIESMVHGYEYMTAANAKAKVLDKLVILCNNVQKIENILNLNSCIDYARQVKAVVTNQASKLEESSMPKALKAVMLAQLKFVPADAPMLCATLRNALDVVHDLNDNSIPLLKQLIPFLIIIQNVLDLLLMGLFRRGVLLSNSTDILLAATAASTLSVDTFKQLVTETTNIMVSEAVGYLKNVLDLSAAEFKPYRATDTDDIAEYVDWSRKRHLFIDIDFTTGKHASQKLIERAPERPSSIGAVGGNKNTVLTRIDHLIDYMYASIVQVSDIESVLKENTTGVGANLVSNYITSLCTALANEVKNARLIVRPGPDATIVRSTLINEYPRVSSSFISLSKRLVSTRSNSGHGFGSSLVVMLNEQTDKIFADDRNDYLADFSSRLRKILDGMNELQAVKVDAIVKLMTTELERSANDTGLLSKILLECSNVLSTLYDTLLSWSSIPVPPPGSRPWAYLRPGTGPKPDTIQKFPYKNLPDLYSVPKTGLARPQKLNLSIAIFIQLLLSGIDSQLILGSSNTSTANSKPFADIVSSRGIASVIKDVVVKLTSLSDVLIDSLFMAASKSFNKILAGMHTESFAVSKKAESIYMTEFATRVAVFSESVISKLCDQSPDRDLLRVYDLCFVSLMRLGQTAKLRLASDMAQFEFVIENLCNTPISTVRRVPPVGSKSSTPASGTPIMSGTPTPGVPRASPSTLSMADDDVATSTRQDLNSRIGGDAMLALRGVREMMFTEMTDIGNIVSRGTKSMAAVPLHCMIWYLYGTISNSNVLYTNKKMTPEDYVNYYSALSSMDSLHKEMSQDMLPLLTKHDDTKQAQCIKTLLS